MLKPFRCSANSRAHVARSVIALVMTVGLALVPMSTRADTSGGQASAYLAYRQSANDCTVWSPLFYNNADWNSTIAIRNESNAAATVDFHMRALLGGGLMTRSVSIPANAQKLITGPDLGLPDGFQGSIAGTANPCGELSAVTYHDAAGRNRITLESPEVADTSLMIPLAFNDYNGWNSMVLVQNTDPDTDATVRVTFRGTDLPTVQVNPTVRRDSSLLLDLTQAPKGALTVEVENRTGNQRLVASAYHMGPNGITDGNNGVAQSLGAGKVFIPLLFRQYNAYNSGVRIVNVREGGAQPKITFYDPNTGDRVGTITASATLLEGEETTFYLPTIDILQDNRVYSAIVETEAGGSATLTALANHVNYVRNTAMLYAGSGRGDTALTAPLVYRGVNGLNSGIQIQNLTGSQASVTVRFKNAAGTTVATDTESAQGNNSVTIYLPAVSGLPDNYTGFAEIISSAQVAATVNVVRYTGAPGTPATPATPGTGA